MRRDPATSDYIDTSSVDVFNTRRLPGRLSMKQVGQLLNFQIYELLLLIHLGRLKCLGAPSPNSRKFFSRAYIEKLAGDHEWLSQSTKAVAKAIREKNGQTAHAFNRTTSDA
jgi:hypothetical protein